MGTGRAVCALRAGRLDGRACVVVAVAGACVPGCVQPPKRALEAIFLCTYL